MERDDAIKELSEFYLLRGHSQSLKFQQALQAAITLLSEGDRDVMPVVHQVLKDYQDGRVHSNPHTRQVARDIAQKIDAAIAGGSNG